jgi:hypothetical protein
MPSVCKQCNIKISGALYKGKINTDIFEQPNDIPSHILWNKNQNLNIPISLGSNLIKRKILFWATSNNVGKYLGDNGGVTKTNKDGKAILRIKCPKSYNDGLPHVHFLIATSNGQQWISNIYTMIVTCKLNKKEMKIAVKNKTHLVIDALPEKFYNKRHIKNAINLSYQKAERLSITQIRKHIKQLCTGFKRYKLLKTPIIVYGYSKECSAPKRLATILNNAGFTNVKLYCLGIWK